MIALLLSFDAEKHYQDAIELYTQAISKNPTSSVYFSNRAFAHIKLEEYGSAIEDASQALKINPSYVKVCAVLFLPPNRL